MLTSYDTTRNENSKKRKAPNATPLDQNEFKRDGTLVLSEAYVKDNIKNIDLSSINFQTAYHGSPHNFNNFSTRMYHLPKQVRMTIQVISQPDSFSRNEKSLQNTTHKKRTLPLAKFFFVLIYFCKILQSSFKPSTIASCSTGAIRA